MHIDHSLTFWLASLPTTLIPSPEQWPYLSLLLTLGFLVGILSGLLGIGGGIQLVPALIYLPPLMGYPAIGLKAATGISAMMGMAGGLSGATTHYKKGNLILPLVVLLGSVAMAGSYLGGLSTQNFPKGLMMMIFLIVTLFAMITYIRRKTPRENEARLTLNFHETLQLPHFGLCLALTFGAGYFSGLLGIGGSLFLLPLMFVLLKIPIKNAIGTASGTVFLISLFALIGKWQTGYIPLYEAIVVTIAGFIGAKVGARLTNRFSDRLLKYCLIALLSIVLLRMGSEILFGI